MSEVKDAPRRAAETRPAAPPPMETQGAGAAPPPPPEKPREARPLPVARIHLSHAADGSVGNIWTAIVPEGTEYDDVHDPLFFSLKAMEMKSGDEIRVMHDRRTFHACLAVDKTYIEGFGNQPNRVETYELWHVVPPPLKFHAKTYDLDIKHMGPHLKWCLMRGNSIVQQGHDTQADAERARRNAASSRNTPPKG